MPSLPVRPGRHSENPLPRECGSQKGSRGPNDPSRSLRLATLVPALALVAACGVDSDSRKSDVDPKVDCKCSPVARNTMETRFDLAARSYGSCKAFRDDLNLIRNRKKRREEAWRAQAGNRTPVTASKGENRAQAAPGSATDSAGGAPPVGGLNTDVLTNVQEKGVDEPDIYKIGANHVLSLVNGTLHAVDRATLKPFSPLALDAHIGAKMFVDGDRLIVIDVLEATQGTGPVTQETRIRALRLPAGAPPEVAQTVKVAGASEHARLAGGKLVVVATSDLGEQELGPFDKGVLGVACEAIHAPAFHNMNESFTNVSVFDASNLEAPARSAGFLGSGDFLYMSRGAIYVASVASASDSFLPPSGDPEVLGNERERLLIHRLPFDPKAGLGKPALGAVKGRAKDVWAFKETGPKGEHLAVATTTGQLLSTGKDAASNHLTILERRGSGLVESGRVSDFGRNEDIRSIRYVGDTAYAVTFKKTDPLFAIDISDPKNPRVTGELKIPGFSTYLHPVGKDRLVGLGYDAADQGDFALYKGVQFSLFDVSDEAKPKRLDVKIHGQRGSSSEATADHHAFFHDPEAGLVAFPIVEVANFDQGRGTMHGSEPKPLFSGAVFYDVTGDTLKEVARVSQGDWIPTPCRRTLAFGSWWESPAKAIDVARVFRAGGELLTLSPYGLKAWANGIAAPATREAHWDVKDCPRDAGVVRRGRWSGGWGGGRGGVAVD